VIHLTKTILAINRTSHENMRGVPRDRMSIKVVVGLFAESLWICRSATKALYRPDRLAASEWTRW
jgi:hypothetical protein